MNIWTFPSGPFETNAYVIACEKTQSSVIVDPAPDSALAIIQCGEENNLTFEKILLTHTHWDHIGDVFVLKEKYQIPVCVHQLDVPNLENPGVDGLPCWVEIQGVTPEELVSHGDILKVGTLEFEVIHTPGHTPGGVCFYCKEHRVLISGDTLFKGSIGNLSFPTADPEKMWESLSLLSHLPMETGVFPGHGPATTLGEESWLPKAKEIFG